MTKTSKSDAFQPSSSVETLFNKKLNNPWFKFDTIFFKMLKNIFIVFLFFSLDNIIKLSDLS